MPGPPSSRSPFPSSSGEPSLRRLGVGEGPRSTVARADRGGAGHGTRAGRGAHVLDAPAERAATGEGRGFRGAVRRAVALGAALRDPDATKPPERLKLGAPQRVRCGNGRGNQVEGSACDQLPAFEEALAKAIRDTDNCAPRSKLAGTINHVLTVDFVEKRLHVFPGASGDFRGPQARRSTECVKRALPKPDWAAVPHQFRRYTIAILATYLPENAIRDPNAPPSFQ